MGRSAGGPLAELAPTGSPSVAQLSRSFERAADHASTSAPPVTGRVAPGTPLPPAGPPRVCLDSLQAWLLLALLPGVLGREIFARA